MKKIILATIFSLLSFSLMAENYINNNQDINRNSLSISFGPTFANNKEVSDNKKLPKDLNHKLDANFAYLRKLSILDNRLSIGFDIESDVVKKYNYEYRDENYFESGTINLQTVAIANIILDFEILRLSNFITSVQLGLGTATNYLSIDGRFKDSDDNGSYNISHFA